jgi:hypothetical protein
MTVIAQAQIEAPTRERRFCTILRFQRDESPDWRPLYHKTPFRRMAFPALNRNGIRGTLRSSIPALPLTSLLAALTNRPS